MCCSVSTACSCLPTTLPVTRLCWRFGYKNMGVCKHFYDTFGAGFSVNSFVGCAGVALVAAQRAQQLQPKHARITFAVAQLQRDLRQWKAAILELEKCLLLEPACNSAHRARCRTTQLAQCRESFWECSCNNSPPVQDFSDWQPCRNLSMSSPRTYLLKKK